MEQVNPISLTKLGVNSLAIEELQDIWKQQGPLWNRVISKHAV